MERPDIDQQITFLTTHDLAATARFYETVLGFPLIVDQGTCRIYRVAGSAYVGFCQRPAAPVAAGDLILTLVTDDVDGWYAYLRALDVAFEAPPEINQTYDIYQCFARDPNGYLIEIQRFLDHEWLGADGSTRGR